MPRYSLGKIRFTSSTRLDTSTTRLWCAYFAALRPTRRLTVCFSTAPKARSTRKESAGAIRKRASVSCFLAGNFFRAWCSWVCGDRSRVVLLSEQIRCAIQMIVFYFAEMGAIERTDWTICGPDWVKADGCDKPMD